MTWYRFVILLCFASGITEFLSADEKQQILFSGLKNNVQLLDQSLEYKILDSDAIQIGPLVIDSKEFSIHIEESQGQPHLVMTGPSQFMKNAQLIFKNPTGVTIWQSLMASEKLQFQNGKKEYNPLKNEIGIFTSEENFNKFAEIASKLLFVNVCIAYSEKLFQYTICSQGYQVRSIYKVDSKQNNIIWEIQPLNNPMPEALIQVNGAEIGEHGQIQFSKGIKSIAFSAKLRSGLRLELKTTSIPIEIIDFYQNENTSQLVFTLVRKNLGRKNKSWQTSIPIDNSYFYLEEDHLLPLKQLLILKKPYPQLKYRPSIQSASYTDIYQDNHIIEIEKSKDFELKSFTLGDKIYNDSAVLLWKLNRLKPNVENKHYIQVHTNAGDFTGAFLIRRNFAWEWKLGAGLTQLNSIAMKSSGFVGAGSVLYNWSNLLGVGTPWSILHWSTEFCFDYNQWKNSESKKQLQNLRVNWNYSFRQGVQYQKKGFEVQISYLQSAWINSQITDGDFSVSGFGLGLLYKDPFFESVFFGKRIIIQANYFPLLQNSTNSASIINITSSSIPSQRFQLQAEFQYLRKASSFYYTNFNYTKENINSVLTMNIGLGNNF